MLIVHILGSILFGLLTAFWAGLGGASTLGMIGCYVLGGSVGLLGTAGLLLVLPPKDAMSRVPDGASHRWLNDKNLLG